jgi:hypothetical protein
MFHDDDTMQASHEQRTILNSNSSSSSDEINDRKHLITYR